MILITKITLTAPILSVSKKEFTNDKGENVEIYKIRYIDQDTNVDNQDIQSVYMSADNAHRIGLNSDDTVKSILNKECVLIGKMTANYNQNSKEWFQKITISDLKLAPQKTT